MSSTEISVILVFGVIVAIYLSVTFWSRLVHFYMSARGLHLIHVEKHGDHTGGSCALHYSRDPKQALVDCVPKGPGISSIFLYDDSGPEWATALVARNKAALAATAKDGN